MANFEGTYIPKYVSDNLDEISIKMGGVPKEIIIAAALKEFSSLDELTKTGLIRECLCDGKMEKNEKAKTNKWSLIKFFKWLCGFQ